MSQPMIEELRTLALAALRETHHLIPKDSEPAGWLYTFRPVTPQIRPIVSRHKRLDLTETGYTDTPLYALEKRHDD